MSKVWKGLLLFTVLLMSLSTVAAHDSRLEIETNSGFSIVEQSGVSDDASVRVIPDAGLAGSTHTILISGLNNGEEIAVSILYDGEEVYSAKRTADNRGRVEVEIFTELSDPIGEYIVEVLNTSGDVIGSDTLTIIEQSGLNATLEISPSEAEVGTVFAINISEVHAFLDLQVVFRDADGVVAYSTLVRADVDGFASVEFPTDEIAAGTYSVSVVLESDRNREVASGAVTVLEQSFVITTSVEPAEVRPNREISISIDGLEAGSNATVEILSPNGESIHSEEISADENGLANVVYTLPEDSTLGDYSVQVLQDGNIVSESNFTVFVPEFAVSISPENGTPNTNFLVEMVGLNENETVIVELVSNGVVLQSIDVTADIDGNANALIGQRLQLEIGVYAIRVMRGNTIIFGQPITITEQFVSPPSAVEVENITISVEPESGAIPTDYLFHVEGLPANADIRIGILFNGEEVYSTSGTSDDDGIFDIIINSENGDSEGVYTFEVGIDGEVVGSSEFLIGEAEAETDETTEASDVVVTVDPESGPIPTTYTFNIEGAEPNAELNIDILFEGEVIFSTSRSTDDNGNVEFAINSETSDPEGVYTLEASYEGDVIGSVDFVAGEAPVEPDESPETDETTETDENAVSISLKPSVVLQGERVEILVDNLDAGETVTIEIRYGMDSVYSVEREASDTGAIGLAVGIEDTDPTGIYGIVVLRGEEIVANAALNVVEDESSLPEILPEISVTPDSGPIGTDHIIEITGLNAEESLEISLDFEGEEVLNLERSADKDGKLVVVVGSELDDSSGDYVIRVVREDGTELSSSLTIEDSILLGDADISIDPQRGVIETDHRISVSGLLPNENVTLDIEFDGDVVYSTERSADENGRFFVDITSQEGDEFGEYDVIVRRENGDESSASFVVESPVPFEVVVEPDIIRIGDSFDIVISGLNAGENVSIAIVVDGDVVFETDGQADDEGTIVFDLFSEEGDAPGVTTVVVSRENGETASADFELVATETSPSDIEITVEPARGPIDTDYEFSITGLEANSSYEFVVEFEGNEVYLSTVEADDEGEASITLTSQEGDAIGVYRLVILGDDGAELASIDFEITGDDIVENTPVVAMDGMVHSGRINADTGEMVFTFSGDAGQEMLISLSSNEFDSFLILQDENGQELATNDNYGNGRDSQIGSYALPYSGEYQVVVSSADYQTERETVFGNFVLLIEPFDSISSEYGDTLNMEFDENSISQFIEFEGHAGDVISIAVDSDLDTVLTVLDPSSMQVIEDDDSGLSYAPEINRLVLAESGVYTVIVRSFILGESGEADVTIALDEQQTLDNDSQIVELSSKTNYDILVFDGQAGETVILTVELESGNIASLSISAEQFGVDLMSYQTLALADRITLSFIVPDNGIVIIQVEDDAVQYAVLSFAIERE